MLTCFEISICVSNCVGTISIPEFHWIPLFLAPFVPLYWTQEVRQGVDGVCRTVGSLLGCRWRVRWSSLAHDSGLGVRTCVRACHRTRRGGWRYGVPVGTKKKRSKVDRRRNKTTEFGLARQREKEMDRRDRGERCGSEPVKWCTKRAAVTTAAEGAWLQLPFSSSPRAHFLSLSLSPFHPRLARVLRRHARAARPPGAVPWRGVARANTH